MFAALVYFASDTNDRHTERFDEFDADRMVVRFDELKEEGFEIYIVNRNDPTPPPSNFKHQFPDSGWCPYCGSERWFESDIERDGHFCYVCQVSDHQYYVKLYNPHLNGPVLANCTFKDLKGKVKSTLKEIKEHDEQV